MHGRVLISFETTVPCRLKTHVDYRAVDGFAFGMVAALLRKYCS